MQEQAIYDPTMDNLLRYSPELVGEYLASCFELSNEPGGQEALLMALRQFAEAQGVNDVAKVAGMPPKSLRQALSVNGNPTLKTLLAILRGLRLKLSASRRE